MKIWKQNVLSYPGHYAIQPDFSMCTYYKNLQLVWALGKRPNFKTGVSRKKARQIFRKANISYPLICTHMCAHQGLRNVRFS